MHCAATKTKGEVIYPAQWLNRTGLEEKIFADEPFPGCGLRTEDLDVPPYSSFFKSAPAAPPQRGAGGLDSAPVVQPAPVRYRHAKRVEAVVEFLSLVGALLAVLALFVAVAT